MSKADPSDRPSPRLDLGGVSPVRPKTKTRSGYGGVKGSVRYAQRGRKLVLHGDLSSSQQWRCSIHRFTPTRKFRAREPDGGVSAILHHPPSREPSVSTSTGRDSTIGRDSLSAHGRGSCGGIDWWSRPARRRHCYKWLGRREREVSYSPYRVGAGGRMLAIVR